MFRNAEIFNQYLSDWGNLVFKILKHLKNNLIFKNSFRLEETAQTRESRGAQARRPAPACYVGVAIRHGWRTRRCRRVSATWRAAPRALPRPFPVPAPGAGRSPGPTSLGLARLHRPRPPSRGWGSASLLLSNRDDFSPFGELRVDSRAAGGSVSTSLAGSSRGAQVGGSHSRPSGRAACAAGQAGASEPSTGVVCREGAASRSGPFRGVSLEGSDRSEWGEGVLWACFLDHGAVASGGSGPRSQPPTGQLLIF